MLWSGILFVARSRPWQYPKEMPVVVTLDRTTYCGFVRKLSLYSLPYQIMRNLIPDPSWSDADPIPVMKVTCEIEEARVLLDLANRVYPDAAPDISKAIDSVSETPAEE
jgi:hypothetical protein